VDNDSTAVANSADSNVAGVAPNTSPASGATSSSSDVVIETQNLSKVYKDFWGRKKVHALKSLDIEVRKGEIFGLLGPNGSGKSTTIKLVLGLLFPTSGRVLVFDKDATETKKNERIGYLPEESYLYQFLNAEETLDFYGRLFDMSGRQRKERIEELLNLVGLQAARHRQLREYSKGMRRRVGLAQALINDPDLILLDEPTTGLDPIGIREMKDLILALRDQGKTVLLCSHQLGDVQDVCDRVAILHQGELKELGRVKDLLKVQEVTEVHASGLSEDAKREIAELIARHGGDLKSMDNPTATMEDLFLNIVRESEARPGARRVSVAADGAAAAAGAPGGESADAESANAESANTESVNGGSDKE
jgi:ABC-2 type transport system ATP-binding protein